MALQRNFQSCVRRHTERDGLDGMGVCDDREMANIQSSKCAGRLETREAPGRRPNVQRLPLILRSVCVLGGGEGLCFLF